MKDLLFYVFYKASKFYKSFGERYYYISGKYVLLLTLGLNVLSLIQIVCRILKIGFKAEVIIVVCLLFVLFGYFIPWEKKYKELEEKYKNEDITNNILSIIATIISSDFSIVDMNPEIDGKRLDTIAINVIIEEVEMFILMC